LLGSSPEDGDDAHEGEHDHSEDVLYAIDVQRDGDHDSCINVQGLAHALKKWEPHTASTLSNANVKWTNELIYRVLCNIRKVDVARNFFSWVQDQPGFRFSAPVMSRMIVLLAMNRDMLAVEHLMSKARKEGIPLSVHVLTAVVKAYGLMADTNKAMQTFHRLEEYGLQPNMEVYENVIHALVKQRQCSKAKEYFDRMKISGLRPSAKVCAMLIECFGLCNRLDTACAIFRERVKLRRETDADLFTAMIKAYFWNRKPDAALETFKAHKQAGLDPTPECMDAMNKGLCSLNRSREAKALRYAMDASKQAVIYNPEVLIKIDDILEKSFVGVSLACNK
jgi:pentatricopeptide repeat protein